jgi:hypothetical protein
MDNLTNTTMNKILEKISKDKNTMENISIVECKIDNNKIEYCTRDNNSICIYTYKPEKIELFKRAIEGKYKYFVKKNEFWKLYELFILLY